MSRLSEAISEQIAREFAAAQQYIAIAVHFDAQTLPGLASHFYRQAVEERNHAMIMVQYLLDAGEQPEIPGVAAPRSRFADAIEPVQLALDQERTVTDEIVELAKLARAENDLVAENFLGWFLAEQREEIASVSALLKIVERAGEDNLLLVEDYLSRTGLPVSEPSTAPPPAAGGAL